MINFWKVKSDPIIADTKIKARILIAKILLFIVHGNSRYRFTISEYQNSF